MGHLHDGRQEPLSGPSTRHGRPGSTLTLKRKGPRKDPTEGAWSQYRGKGLPRCHFVAVLTLCICIRHSGCTTPRPLDAVLTTGQVVLMRPKLQHRYGMRQLEISLHTSSCGRCCRLIEKHRA